MNEKRCTRLVHQRNKRAYEHAYGITMYADGTTVWSWFDDPVCETCGQRAATERHHRKNRSQGGTWTPSNILLICHQCHQWTTEHPTSAADMGWSVKSHQTPSRVPVKVWYAEDLVLLDDEGGWKDGDN